MKQHIKPFYQFINEEHVFHNKSLDIYKNPQSIKRMSPWKRAISDKDGNLFVMDDPYFVMVHDGLVKILNSKGEVESSSNYESILGNFIAWTQPGNKSEFYLSESYSTNRGLHQWHALSNYKDHIKEFTKYVEKKNPQFKYVQKRIWDVYEQPESIDDMQKGYTEKI
jgi:hypothetical protein